MNLSTDKRCPDGGISGGGAGNWGQQQAAPAHPMAVGAVGFGPGWTMEDSMAASIIRLEQENQELRETIEHLRDRLCADKCRDKAAADRGWANI